jgi:hypothetical protein
MCGVLTYLSYPTLFLPFPSHLVCKVFTAIYNLTWLVYRLIIKGADPCSPPPPPILLQTTHHISCPSISKGEIVVSKFGKDSETESCEDFLFVMTGSFAEVLVCLHFR